MKPKLRRLLHRLLFSVAALITLVVLFYAEEDWRGARAWATVKRDLRAQGESVDLRDFIPPLIPDEQNLAMAPLFQRLFQYEVDPRTHLLTFNREWYKSDTWKLFEGMPFGRDKPGLLRPVSSNWLSGHFLDLSAMQRYYRQRPEFPHAPQPQGSADDVLLALTRYSPLLDELARASAERPQTRFPVNWSLRPSWNISLPHYNEIQLLTTTLRWRAVAELATGQTLAARYDIEQMFRLRRGLEKDPVLVASLVDSTCIGLLVQPLWEGLAARRWSADDLDVLRAGLRDINMLREYQLAIRGGERACFVARWPEDLDMAHAREFSKVLPILSAEEIRSSSLALERWLWQVLPFWPHGWYEQNAAFASRYFQDYFINAVDPAGHQVSPTRIKLAGHVMRDTLLTPDNLMAKIGLSVIPTLAEKFAHTQTVVDQAVIACALEKYYLHHQTYPEALATLLPNYLERVPNDVIDGAPMRYRRTVDGRYQLYSIGWDEKDGGGAIDWPPDRKWRRAGGEASAAQPKQPFPSPSRDQGDWVWQYAPAEPPDPPENESRLESLP